MNLIQRVQDILLRPKATWPVIEAEPSDIGSIYKGYVAILALIPALAGFIGMSLIGVSVGGMTTRVPIVTGLVTLVVGYVISLVMVYVVALIVDALAPSFGGTKNMPAAFKLVAYAYTAAYVGGIFALLPALALIGVLVGLYSIYLIYTGLPVLMKCPPDKALVYTAMTVVCLIGAGILLSVVLSMLRALTI